jgi:transcriptional regulator with XRE-family HTH domain
MNEFNFGENLRIIRQAKGISQEAATGRNISDLVPKIGFEQQAKEIINTRVGG